MTGTNGTVNRVEDKYARHEAKVVDLIRNRLREARGSRVTGDLIIRISLNKGGPTNVFTEVGVTYKILEEV